jgi:hypothetical protein
LAYYGGMRKSEAIEFFGSQVAIAKALGIAEPSVSTWEDDAVPPLRQLQLEALSGGKLKADPSILPAPQQAAGGVDRTGQMG